MGAGMYLNHCIGNNSIPIAEIRKTALFLESEFRYIKRSMGAIQKPILVENRPVLKK